MEYRTLKMTQTKEAQDFEDRARAAHRQPVTPVPKRSEFPEEFPVARHGQTRTRPQEDSEGEDRDPAYESGYQALNSALAAHKAKPSAETKKVLGEAEAAYSSIRKNILYKGR